MTTQLGVVLMTTQEFEDELNRLEHNTRFLRLEKELLKRQRKAFEDRTLLNDYGENRATIVAGVDFSLFLFDKYALNIPYDTWTTSPITSKPGAFILNSDQTFCDTSLTPENSKGNIIEFVGLLSNINLDESYDLIKDYLKWGPVLW